MLKELIDSQSSVNPLLPISHITGWSEAESIVSCGFLSCDVSEDKRICFFYGPPFYKTKSAGGNNTTLGLMFNRPIGMVFKSDLIKNAKKAYPFDSGAFAKHFKKYFPEKYDLSKFEISPICNDTIGQLVSFLYGNNDNYIFGKSILTPPFNPITEGLSELYNSKVIANHDERNHGIELQYFEDVFIENNLELLVLPKRVYEENKDKFPVDLKKYSLDFYLDSYRYDPEADSLLVQAKVKEYLNRSYPTTVEGGVL